MTDNKLPDYFKQPSEWFTEIIKQAELADIRYGVKGAIVFQPWSVECMELMYDFFEDDLKKGVIKIIGFLLLSQNPIFKKNPST